MPKATPFHPFFKKIRPLFQRSYDHPELIPEKSDSISRRVALVEVALISLLQTNSSQLKMDGWLPRGGLLCKLP